MSTPVQTKPTRITFGISVTPAVQRAIEELLLTRRTFSRSALIVDAIVEKAERELPANWRETVGMEDERGVA